MMMAYEKADQLNSTLETDSLIVRQSMNIYFPFDDYLCM